MGPGLPVRGLILRVSNMLLNYDYDEDLHNALKIHQTKSTENNDDLREPFIILTLEYQYKEKIVVCRPMA